MLDCDAASWGDPLADWTITRALSRAGTEVDAFWQTYGRQSGRRARPDGETSRDSRDGRDGRDGQDSGTSEDSRNNPDGEGSQASQIRALIYRARHVLGARLDIHRRGLRLRDIPPVHWDVTDILGKLA